MDDTVTEDTWFTTALDAGDEAVFSGVFAALQAGEWSLGGFLYEMLLTGRELAAGEQGPQLLKTGLAQLGPQLIQRGLRQQFQQLEGVGGDGQIHHVILHQDVECLSQSGGVAGPGEAEPGDHCP